MGTVCGVEMGFSTGTDLGRRVQRNRSHHHDDYGPRRGLAGQSERKKLVVYCVITSGSGEAGASLTRRPPPPAAFHVISELRLGFPVDQWTAKGPAGPAGPTASTRIQHGFNTASTQLPDVGCNPSILLSIPPGGLNCMLAAGCHPILALLTVSWTALRTSPRLAAWESDFSATHSLQS